MLEKRQRRYTQIQTHTIKQSSVPNAASDSAIDSANDSAIDSATATITVSELFLEQLLRRLQQYYNNNAQHSLGHKLIDVCCYRKYDSCDYFHAAMFTIG